MTASESTFAPSSIQERWAAIAGFESTYEVSDMGRVRRITTRAGRSHISYLLTHAGNTGYPRVILTHLGKSKKYLLHRLVAAAFIGPCPDGVVVHHRNGQKDDPRACNLEYATQSQNQQYAMADGRKRPLKGAAHPFAVLTEDEAKAIRTSTETEIVLAARYNVATTTIGKLRRGKSWAHIAEQRQQRPPITHCKNGHEFTPENTHVARNQRVCRACTRESSRLYRLRATR